MKRYIDYLNQISPDDLFEGLLGHGLFAEKYPLIFTSEKICDYNYFVCFLCKSSE